MIGISPRLFYQPTSDEWIGMVERKFPTNWIIVQIEVSKIKSSDSKEKKKEKKVKEEDVAIAVATPQQVAPPSDSTPDIKSRMAKVAAAAGGGPQQLGNILSGRKQASVAAVAEEPVVEVSSPTPVIAVVAEAIPTAPLPAQQAVQVKAPIPAPAPAPTPVAVTPVATATAAYRPQDSILAQKEAMLQQSQDTINQQMSTSGASPAYAFAVAAESTSMIVSDGGLRDRNVAMLLENNQQTQQQYFTQFQQSMMIIQQSMMQMHTKLDQVGMSVNNTFSLVQQQSSALTTSNSSSGMGAMGMGNMGMMGMNPMNMGMGGMNPMNMGMGMGMNPMMMQQMGYGNGNMNSSFYGNNNGNNSNNPMMRGKVDELVSTAQFLVQQYDQLKRENDDLQQRSQSQYEVQNLQEQIMRFKATVADLESQRSQWQVRVLCVS